MLAGFCATIIRAWQGRVAAGSIVQHCWMGRAMGVLYDVEHVSTYRYRNPVKFGTHRAMFLPRSGPYGRILSYSVTTNLASRTRWIFDALSNVVTVMEIDEPGTELTFTFRLRGVHYGVAEAEAFPVEARAETLPVQYTPDEWNDLSAYLRPHADDFDGTVASWAKSFMVSEQASSLNVIKRMVDTIGATFDYQAREAQGTQSPADTLRARAGTCRDFAWLMIEALRRIGFACRFISGYVYDASRDAAAIVPGRIGSGATHAWVQVYLPGAGWLHYDPTNRINGGLDLIPVAIARHPGQAIPLQGTWFGSAGDSLGLSVKVAIRRLEMLVEDPRSQ
jgi:transglutaminase-like putative cysteine protease